jgi:hypothetical protein
VPNRQDASPKQTAARIRAATPDGSAAWGILARSRPPSAPLAFRRGTSRVETAAVVDLVDESRKVVGDIGEGSVGHRIDGFDLERFMKLSALALS